MEFVSEFAWHILIVLRRHPRSSVELEMHSHDSAYLAPFEETPISRRIPKFQINGAYESLGGGLPTRLKLHKSCPFVEPVQLEVDGLDRGNKVCRVLFHRNRFGPIIPLGDSKWGGSVLVADGTEVLDTEWFYLFETGV